MNPFCEILGRYIDSHQKILFLGVGVYGFVEYWFNQGIETYGCKQNVEHPYIYNKKVIDVNFPTDHFSAIIYRNDHCLTLRLAQEIFRILKPINENGRFIFETEKNKNIDHFENILTKATFAIESVKNENKRTIIQARKPKQQRIKILVPPGIGDIYWILVKLQDFIKKNKTGLPEICVYGYIDNRYNSHNRAFPFIEMFPFVKASWKTIDLGKNDYVGIDFERTFNTAAETIIPNVLGCDYFMVYNGFINTGKTLEEANPELTCNWNIPIFESIQQRNYEQKAKREYGDYAIIHFKFKGTYKSWTKFLTVDHIIDMLNKLSAQLHVKLIYVGGQWDNNDMGIQRILTKIPSCINLIGKTTLEEVFGLIKGSKFVVGYPSGITMFAPVLGVKTLLAWSDLYPPATSWNVVPPTVRGNTYFAEQMSQKTSGEHLLNILKGILNG